MTQQTIEIEGLPEGWKAVAYRCPRNYEKFFDGEEIHTAGADMAFGHLIVEKIQPRRIVLEETEQDNKRSGLGFLSQQFSSGITIYDAHKIWKEVKE